MSAPPRLPSVDRVPTLPEPARRVPLRRVSQRRVPRVIGTLTPETLVTPPVQPQIAVDQYSAGAIVPLVNDDERPAVGNAMGKISAREREWRRARQVQAREPAVDHEPEVLTLERWRAANLARRRQATP